MLCRNEAKHCPVQSLKPGVPEREMQMIPSSSSSWEGMGEREAGSCGPALPENPIFVAKKQRW